MIRGEAIAQASQFDAALRTIAGIAQDGLPPRDRVWLRYLKACCLRRLGKLPEAGVLYREVAESRIDAFLAESSVWHLSSLRWLAQLYTTLIRGVPDLVLMLLVFYGGQMLANDLATRLGSESGLDINPFVAGVVTIGFIFGAYLSETFRGAILAIPAGQAEVVDLLRQSGRELTLDPDEAPALVRKARAQL